MKVLQFPGVEKPTELANVRALLFFADERKLSRNDLQTLYNAIPGAPPQKRLRNRPTAIDAIWKALPEVEVKSDFIDRLKTARKHREGSMKEKLIQLLKIGATIQELIALTSWQAHTIRGYISTLKSKGLPVTTTKKDGVTVYGVTE